MNKLINEPRDVVGEALDGLTGAVATTSRLAGWTTAVRSDVAELRAAGKVAVVSGGGAGHEPAHAGYVGAGMLTAAVAGEVFTSPSVDAVLAAIRTVASPAGVLLIVKNYTGDRLNFGLAAELARAEGTPVEVVVVADDVALVAAVGAGRRGIAGTVLVHKVAGAAAEAGLPLPEVAARARAAADAVRTMGVALSACTVPGTARPSFQLTDGEIEWGLGIHGEAGVERTVSRPADAIARGLLDRVVADGAFAPGTRLALLVNGLGATPPIELDVMARAALADLRGRGLVVERIWVGSFLTALDMAGCSLSLLPVDDDVLAALDSPTTAPAWPRHGGAPASEPRPIEPPAGDAVPVIGGGLDAGDPLRRGLEAAAARLLQAEQELTDLDREVGDGDLGTSLSRGARALLEEVADYPGQAGPAAVLRAASATVRRSVGGTSGPLYAVMLMRAAAAVPEDRPVGAAEWAAAFSAAVDGVQEIGGAAPGDRTMVDALRPAADALAADLASGLDPWKALQCAVTAAREGTQATADVQAKLGRSSYLGARAVGHPDPGAHAVTLWLAAVADALGA
ncbi:dihydroxyacetone kinase subunit DhaL [Geodermatophilus ruber]|uniref:Homodimeric dihydroxyacetone kinase n=1 Tax=Geodermatophilus ruber TaxID=504800 RepID=A0A1I4BPZ8_9ACTN|nr:dihydroxyacetone kinase subunit DhaL [Geodermatophilus ruber]SFK70257.1 homodimeric dihydroxyacetone kinase [Geodermatophilus ruber]